MAHVREQLRNKVQTVLKTALSSNNVFVNRSHVLSEAELPGVIITTDRELSEHVTIDGAMDKDIEMSISVHAKAFDGADDDLDDLCVTIEKTVEAIRTDAGESIEYNSTDIDLVDGDQQIAVATMTFTSKISGITDPEVVLFS